MDVHGDFLIIGSGIAALRAAIRLSALGHVAILTKGGPADGNTGYAQGGIAAAVGHEDSPDLHASDTIRAGEGLCDAAAVRALVDDGPRYVRELIEWGAAFDRDADGRPALAREGGHSVRRVLHARDATGREISRTLWDRLKRERPVTVIDRAMAVDVIVRQGTCLGVRWLDRQGAGHAAIAGATLLATGGAGCVFSETTNPPEATADGLAMAWRAGARVCDLEFVQFHPTALSAAGAPRFLLSEALRGEGAHLVNASGEAFMARYDPAADLAPRDRVARAIVMEGERTGGPIGLSLRHLDPAFVYERFPGIASACRQAGLDLARDVIPVGPAAHYIMGGVVTDLAGRTSVPGLFAAGEVARTGVHGANRLASNSLLEGLVFGARAAVAMAEWTPSGSSWPMASGTLPDWPPGPMSAPDPVTGIDADSVRDVMWRQAGLFRDAAGLRAALEALSPAWRVCEELLASGTTPGAAVARDVSLVTAARLIVRAALRREESRGAHFRSDHPRRDDLRWRVPRFDARYEEPLVS